VLVNEETGGGMAISVRADQTSKRASDAGADEMRNRVTDRAGVETDSVEHFPLVRTVQGRASRASPSDRQRLMSGGLSASNSSAASFGDGEDSTRCSCSSREPGEIS
jgi:hypothetical protein